VFNLWQLDVAISKLNRYASRDSGDTVEVVERPSGGLSIVIADAQGSGYAAKTLSNLVTSKAVGLLKEGVRDTAVHEALHDHLYHYRGGRVSCALITISADTKDKVCRITTNSSVPVYLVESNGNPIIKELSGSSNSLGIYPETRPCYLTIPLRPEIMIIAMTDGILNAGRRASRNLDLQELISCCLSVGKTPADLADCILTKAVELDSGRPSDDMSIAILSVSKREKDEERRTMSIVMPIREDMLASEG